MGTVTNGFFPHSVERLPEAIRARLENALGGLSDEMDAISNHGRFSAGEEGWSFWCEEGTVTGEGPCGFSISVYVGVVRLTSVERFGAIERPDQGIHVALRTAFETVAAAFGGSGLLAVAAGGFGDTDRADDIALAGGKFADVCKCLEGAIGPPARSWSELEAGEGNWYLSIPDPKADGGT